MCTYTYFTSVPYHHSAVVSSVGQVITISRKNTLKLKKLMHERMHAYYVSATVVSSKDLDHTTYHHRLQKISRYIKISKEKVVSLLSNKNGWCILTPMTYGALRA